MRGRGVCSRWWQRERATGPLGRTESCSAGRTARKRHFRATERARPCMEPSNEFAGDQPRRWSRPLPGLLPFLAPYTRLDRALRAAGLPDRREQHRAAGRFGLDHRDRRAPALDRGAAGGDCRRALLRHRRGVFRYLERLASHQVTFRVLAAIRVWFYAAIEPLAPARLGRYTSGDLLARVLSDVGMLENFYVRAVAPPLVAVLIGVTDRGHFLCVRSRAGRPRAGAPASGGSRAVDRDALGRPRPGRALAEGRGRAEPVAGRPRAGAARSARVPGGRPAVGARCRRGSGGEPGCGRDDALLPQGQTQEGASSPGWRSAAVLIIATPLVRSGELSGVSLAVLALLTVASFEAVLPLPVASQYLAASSAAARRLFEVAGQGAPRSGRRRGARVRAAPIDCRRSHGPPAQPPCGRVRRRRAALRAGRAPRARPRQPHDPARRAADRRRSERRGQVHAGERAPAASGTTSPARSASAARTCHRWTASRCGRWPPSSRSGRTSSTPASARTCCWPGRRQPGGDRGGSACGPTARLHRVAPGRIRHPGGRRRAQS